MISVDAYPFLAFSGLTCHPEDMGIDVFLVALCCLIVRRLGSSRQESSPSAGKNTGVVLVPSSHMEVHPYSYLQWCKYFRDPWVSFVAIDEFSVRVTKLTSRIGVSELTAYLSIFILFKHNELWPHYQKHVNQIILNRITLIQGLHLNFVDCEYFLESNS